jgi:hypothetical protein
MTTDRFDPLKLEPDTDTPLTIEQMARGGVPEDNLSVDLLAAQLLAWAVGSFIAVLALGWGITYLALSNGWERFHA